MNDQHEGEGMTVASAVYTYSSIFACFRTTAFDCDAVTLVLKTLRCNEALDARSFCIWRGTLLLGCHLTANDEFADLESQ